MAKDEQRLLEKIAPCGMLCHTCGAAADGIIPQHARELQKYLEGFDGYAERLSAHEPRLKQYPVFEEVLGLICEAQCKGCRDGICKFPGCEIAPCAEQLGHDYCFQCESYPCDKADFEPLLKAKWLAANDRMREIGPAAYFAEARGRSHYEAP